VDLLQGERAVPATVTSLGSDEAVVEFDGQQMRARRDGAAWAVGDQTPAETLSESGRVTVFAGPQGTHAFQVPDPLDRASEASSADEVLSPMPGLVRAVLVEAGQEVSRGDRLVVIEAMKMEHALAAPRDGRVAEVLAEEGAQVEAGLPLVRLEPHDG
jgi:3-methylcrotonyl-CoA carboxylase alpha subunit